MAYRGGARCPAYGFGVRDLAGKGFPAYGFGVRDLAGQDAPPTVLVFGVALR